MSAERPGCIAPAWINGRLYCCQCRDCTREKQAFRKHAEPLEAAVADSVPAHGENPTSAPYCSDCGKSLKTMEGYGYERQTGARRRKEICVTEGCPYRCITELAGHDYHWWTGVCRRCGRVAYW